MKEALADFSAVAVDPKTGDLFIASDESASAVQVRLELVDGELVGRFVQSLELRHEEGQLLKRVEGLSFDEAGNMLVLTENDGKLHQFDRRG